MKRKIVLIILTATIIFFAGTSIAYYNTKTFGFDENAKVISRDDEKIVIMDYEINLKNFDKSIDKFIKKAKIVLPTETRLV
ncbi:MAG: hypothetical protein NC213_08965 [Acetobacter sp.]|nr:hypothetical protein [Bacteroides sp.]MCM1341859.1 hypothetical protein [Acetobacter sp.]MCM1434025.1 hypothetical protein [Clostridiales bacterium]